MSIKETQDQITVFQKYLPENAALYCFKIWKDSHFHFKITRKRQSKLGDYSFSPEKGHQVTVNQDLNPYAFLITFLHEVAHYQVFSTYKRRKAPHGKEWKKFFQELMLPVLNETVFPADVLGSLRKYMANPKASSCADPALMKELRKYNKNENQLVLLSELPEGNVFSFQGRQFRKIEKRRTRVLCEEVATKKRYLISGIAEVE
jgi:hypothetical protein